MPTVSPRNTKFDKNLYTYCDNNPIGRKDKDGDLWEIIAIGFGLGVAGQYI